MPTLDDLNRQPYALGAVLPRLVADYRDDADFWPAFAALADVLDEQAEPVALTARGQLAFVCLTEA